MNLYKLDTEQRNQASMYIDKMETKDILQIINNEDKKVPYIVEKCIPEITVLIDECYKRLANGGRIIYIGAGTSGRLGVLDASECPPTYGVDDNLFTGLIAGGYPALLKAQEGAEDDLELCQRDLENMHLNEKDTVIGLAASGRTPYVIGGLQYANDIGALTASISCVHNAQISKYAYIPIEAVTNAEVVTGSTRMKAGTAQKLILNMISTSLMIKYGKVYQNLMVDLQPTNQKLVDRSLRIINEATGCTLEEAEFYLRESNSNVKLAICMLLTKKDRETCLSILEQEKGNISKTIHKLIK